MKSYAAPVAFATVAVASACTFRQHHHARNTIDMGTYLKVLHIIAPAEELNPTVKRLQLVVAQHAKYIPYQNLGLHKVRLLGSSAASPLSMRALSQKLLLQKKGGMCYESSELLFSALKEIGFDVIRVASFPLNGRPYDPSMPSTHNILLVTVSGRRFLVDTSYGYNSLRKALEFEPEDKQVISLSKTEKYQLLRDKDHYTLSLWLEDKKKWVSLYCFSSALSPVSAQETRENNQRLMSMPRAVGIRDTVIKLGMVTLFGRIGFSMLMTEGNDQKPFRIIDKHGRMTKKNYSSLWALQQDITKDLELDLGPVICDELLRLGMEA